MDQVKLVEESLEVKRTVKFEGLFRIVHGLFLNIFSYILSKTAPWVFFTFFKLYKWYQIARSIPN